MPISGEEIIYSDKYCDNRFEYRHVTLPSAMSKLVPKNHLVKH
jgi:Cyclin-dependent kinase regulatory subunit